MIDLSELKSVDLETYKDIYIVLGNILQSQDGKLLVRTPIEQMAYEGIIQVGLQKAIEAKGWRYLVERTRDGRVLASIGIPEKQSIYWGPRRYKDSGVEALLAAYIEGVKHI